MNLDMKKKSSQRQNRNQPAVSKQREVLEARELQESRKICADWIKKLISGKMKKIIDSLTILDMKKKSSQRQNRNQPGLDEQREVLEAREL